MNQRILIITIGAVIAIAMICHTCDKVAQSGICPQCNMKLLPRDYWKPK